MRKLIYAALGLSAAVGVGCGGAGDTVVLSGPMTAQEKKQMQEDDRRIAEEESQGTYGKVRAKKK